MNGPTESPAHIASLVVRARPEAAVAVANRIAAAPDAEVHAVEDGKIVVVIESASERGLADRMDELRAEPGVLFVNLVYHQVDTP